MTGEGVQGNVGERELRMTEKTLKYLFARSRNQCAFPNCMTEIVMDGEEGKSVIGEICHIKARNPGGARYNPTLDAEELDDKDNLILLCRNHHKLIDDNATKYTVEVLKKMKAKHQDNTITCFENCHKEGAKLLYQMYIEQFNNLNISNSHITINTSSVNIKGNKPKFNQAPYSETIGSDRYRRAYTLYLIKRYIELASADKTRKTEFKFQKIYGDITREYGARWDHVSLTRFEDLCKDLKEKIDRTTIARMKKHQGDKYHSFEEHIRIMDVGRTK